MKKKETRQPNNLEAENSILACLIAFQDNEIKETIFLELGTEDFYYDKNKQIFTLCKTLWENKKPIEIPTLMEIAGSPNGLMGDLVSYGQVLPSNIQYAVYINILKAKTNARNLLSIASDIIDGADGDPYKTRDIALSKLSGIGDNHAAELEHIEIASNEALMYVTDLKNGIKVIDGVKTPYQKLNYFLGNFQNGEITILAARPSVGKSAMVSEIILNSALREKKSIALFNLEMNKKQIALRMYANILNKNIYDLTHGEFNAIEIASAAEKLKEAEIYVDTNSFCIEQICRACRVQKKRKGLDLLCVDYLQLVGSKLNFEDRRKEVEYVSRQLKLLAMELNIPVIALSQMNRDVEKSDREPVLSDLRESGAIEQDATHVIFLHRVKAMEKKLEYREDTDRYLMIKIEKNRNGATGNIYMKFEADKMKFIEIDKDGKPIKEQFKQSNLIPIKDDDLPF